MASAIQVARYLQQQPLWDDVQLQKLVYYSQAWALTWTGRPLFDEEIQAWDGGPVTPSVRDLAQHGEVEVEARPLTPNERAIIDAVFAFYGHMGGKKLSALTHAEAPWKDAWADGAGRNAAIECSAMRREYTEKALFNPDSAPVAPVLDAASTSTDSVASAGAIQRTRWRTLLDRLALQ